MRNYVCLDCRAAKRSSSYGAAICPSCGEQMVSVARPPARDDDKGWAMLKRQIWRSANWRKINREADRAASYVKGRYDRVRRNVRRMLDRT